MWQEVMEMPARGVTFTPLECRATETRGIKIPLDREARHARLSDKQRIRRARLFPKKSCIIAHGLHEIGCFTAAA